MAQSTPRLVDIAERCGTSVTSVSRILRNQRLEEYSQDTQDRVRKAAAELGWRPNLIVRGMRTGKTQTIGVFIAPYDTFWTGVLFGVHDTLLESEKVPLVLWPHALVHPTLDPHDANQRPETVSANSDERLIFSTGSQSLTGSPVDPTGSARRELDRINYLEDRRVDAIISWPLQEDNARQRLAMLSNRGWRVVMIDDRLPDAESALFVGMNEPATMKLIAEHLRKLQHQTIGFVGYDRDTTWSRQRREAFLEVFGPDAPMVNLVVDNDDVQDEAIRMLRERPDITGIVAGSDHMARHVCRAALRVGRSVPGDLSVVGYGNDLYGRGDVPLTTIDQRPYDLGKAAADLGINRTGDASSDVLFVGQLVERASTSMRGVGGKS
ncbi:MAG: LacI family DNA-binding transcriptional regulator [Planctomycetota bacterium]